MNYSAFFIASLFVFLFSCNDSAKKKTIRSESSPEIDVTHDRDAQKVIIKVGGELFTSYLYNELKEKPFLYPLKSSQGNIVTRGWPLDSRPGERVDHPHQVGCWFNFGDVNGLDFWNNSYAVPKDEKHEYGSIKHKQVVKAESEDKKGVVTVKSDWIDHQGEILLAEEAKMIF